MNYFELYINIDLDANGLNKGHIHFFLEKKWLDSEILKIPIYVINNGIGPTILLTSGNHGDEYEGIITLTQFIKELIPEKVSGKIIIIPYLNLPAVQKNKRISPIDGKNLNRVWPGSKTGTITERIVNWISDNLFIKNYYFMDFHTGGRLFRLIPMSLFHNTLDENKYNLLKNLQAVFNSQLSVELNVEGKRLNTAGAYANKKGLLSIGSESGGGEAVNQKSYLNCYNGLRRILDYLNIYEANLSIKLLNNKTIYTKKSGKNGEINATCNGIFIPSVSLWDNVKEKQVIGHIVDIFKDTNEKNTIYANNYGIIVGIRNCSSVNENDTLFWIVQYVK